MPPKSRYKRLKKLVKKNPQAFRTMVNTKWFLKKWLPTHMKTYAHFCELALALRRKNPDRKYSARLIMGKLVWDFTIEYDIPDDQTYKINSKSTPYMARLAMLEFSSLDGMFSTRRKIKGTNLQIDERGVLHPKE